MKNFIFYILTTNWAFIIKNIVSLIMIFGITNIFIFLFFKVEKRLLKKILPVNLLCCFIYLFIIFIILPEGFRSNITYLFWFWKDIDIFKKIVRIFILLLIMALPFIMILINRYLCKIKIVNKKQFFIFLSFTSIVCFIYLIFAEYIEEIVFRHLIEAYDLNDTLSDYYQIY